MNVRGTNYDFSAEEVVRAIALLTTYVCTQYGRCYMLLLHVLQ